jgi:hypothetical protein
MSAQKIPASRDHPRRPLVFASQHAVEQARAVLPHGRVVENEVERAISANRISHEPRRPGDLARVQLDGGLVALVGRDRRKPSGRKCWVIASVQRDVGGQR